MSRPNEASEWPPQISAILTQSGSSCPQRERRDGWCGGVHFLIYPIHLTFNLPGAFQKRLSLKLSVLSTKIPVACVGVLTILGLAVEFSLVPLHSFVAGTRGSLGRNYPLPIPQQWHPRALLCLRAHQLPNWGVPSMATPPQRSRGRLAPQAPSLGIRAQCTAHAATGAPGPASAGHPYPLRYPGPPWALGLQRPTSPVPGVPTQRYSPFAATLPTRQQDSCTPPKWVRAYIPTNNKTTSILSI